MSVAASLLVVTMFCVAIGYVINGWRIRMAALDRLVPLNGLAERQEKKPETVYPIIHRYVELCALAGILVALVCFVFFGVGATFACAFGLIAALLLGQIEMQYAEYIELKYETQLAETIDLLVGSLRVGASVSASLASTVREMKEPLRSPFEDMLNRIRLGDDPHVAIRQLVQRLPLDSFRLFGTVLSVQWESGGNLTSALASVGRAIRDRIEVARRLRTVTVQVRLTTFFVIVLTYVLFYLVYRANPPRVRAFLASDFGQYLVVLAILLQAVGIWWQSAMSRIKI